MILNATATVFQASYIFLGCLIANEMLYLEIH